MEKKEGEDKYLSRIKGDIAIDTTAKSTETHNKQDSFKWKFEKTLVK